MLEKKQQELEQAERDLYIANNIINQLTPEWYKILIENSNFIVILRTITPDNPKKANETEFYNIGDRPCALVTRIYYGKVKEYVKSLEVI